MFYTLIELATKMNVSQSEIQHLISQGEFPNHKISNTDDCLVPHKDLKNYEKKIIKKENYFTVSKTAQYLNLREAIIRNMIKAKIFNNVAKFTTFKGYYIPKSDILSYQTFMNEYCTIDEAIQQFNLTSGQINNLLKNNQLSKARKHKITSKWMLSKDQLITFINSREVPEGFFSIQEVGKRIGRNPEIVKKYIREERFFINSRIIKRKYYIPESDIQAFEKAMTIPKGFISITEACKLLNKDDSTLHAWIKKKRLPNSYFDPNLRKHLINLEDIRTHLDTPSAPKGYITLEQTADLMSNTTENVQELIKNKTLQVVHYEEQMVFISKKEVLDFVASKKKKRSNNSLSVEEAAAELSCSKKEILELVNQGDLKALDVTSNTLLISQDSLSKVKKYKTYDYSTDAINTYQEKLNQNTLPMNLPKTIHLYNQFVILKISQTRGIKETFSKKISLFLRVIQTISIHLHKEIYLLSDKDIEVILHDSTLPDYIKENFIHFLNFCKTKVDCSFEKEYKVAYKEITKQNKDIYDKSTFLSYYTYIRNIDLHLEHAIRNSSYARTWLFVIMHMINGWRKNTIVHELPNLPIESIPELNFYTLKNLKKVRLSLVEAQRIINFYYELCGKIYISKSFSFGQFLSNQDMVLPTANALLICELHRRSNNKSNLLGALKSFTNTSERFVKFFNQNPSLPMFNSLKMNRSLLTHFFYTVTESGENPEISYEMTKNLRSHTNIDSTQAYIQSTNKDGALDKVTVNLFNRGHFGWLYNFLIDITFGKGRINELEEKTLLIQAYKNDFTPNELEGLSYFLLKQQSDKKTLMDTLSNIPKDLLKEKVLKILKGEMPSKTKHAQCITYPHCPYPNLENCLGCSNAILKVHLLISIIEEIKKVSTSIQTSNYEVIRHRDTLAFLKLLQIINQAIDELGQEYVSSFIDLIQLKNLIIDINENILIENPKYLQSN